MNTEIEKMKICVGDRFFSSTFKKYGIVTEYINDDIWYFKFDEPFYFITKYFKPQIKAVVNVNSDRLVWVFRKNEKK